MKKSNIIVLALSLAASLFLLWLWWYLGFAKVDTPPDVLITVAWWLAIGLVVYGIHHMEEKRRQQMRTVYISPTALFNCESGLIECRNPFQQVELTEEILKSMDYKMDFQDMPDPAEFAYSYIIRTEKYSDAENWRVTLVKVDRGGNSEETKFDSRETLLASFK